MPFLSKSLEDTKRFAAKFLTKLRADRARATVVGLHGNLGSGKTTFVQCAAEFFGVREHLTSPTFVILKTYPLSAKRYTLLHHIDAYRLKSGEELLKLGWRELLSDRGNLIFIEWPEHVADVLPDEYAKLNFEFVDETTRRIGPEL